MNALFFGESSRQLFGCYHEPRGAERVRGAALVCPSWGHEYIVSYRTLRSLAVRLSDAGFHVLRFDYYGTGDSAGERHEGDLATWLEDATTAAEELKEMSGQRTLTTIGVRLGSVIAYRLAAARTDVERLVMWDPVLDGTRYLQELSAIQTELDRWSIETPFTHPPSQDGITDLLGMPLASSMRSTIEAVAPREYAATLLGPVNAFYSHRFLGQDQVQAEMTRAGTKLDVRHVHGDTPWRRERFADVGRVPHGVLEQIVEVMR